jgi:hypothetical protein
MRPMSKQFSLLLDGLNWYETHVWSGDCLTDCGCISSVILAVFATHPVWSNELWCYDPNRMP